MHKVISLYKRKPGLSVGEFHQRFYDVAQQSTPPQGYKKGELLFDGVSESWFTDLAGAEAAPYLFKVQHGSAAGIDGLTDAQQTVHMLVDPHVVKDMPVPRGAMKNIEFVNRRPGMPFDTFRTYWREVHGPSGSRIETMLRYEQNHSRFEAQAGTGHRYDGLAITWFASTAAMRAGAQTENYAITRADEVNLLPDGHLPISITTEALIRASRSCWRYGLSRTVFPDINQFLGNCLRCVAPFRSVPNVSPCQHAEQPEPEVAGVHVLASRQLFNDLGKQVLEALAIADQAVA